MRKRKGSQAERRQIPAPGALSTDCQSTSDAGWDNTAACNREIQFNRFLYNVPWKNEPAVHL